MQKLIESAVAFVKEHLVWFLAGAAGALIVFGMVIG